MDDSSRLLSAIFDGREAIVLIINHKIIRCNNRAVLLCSFSLFLILLVVHGKLDVARLTVKSPG